jgi:hypothetical protein
MRRKYLIRFSLFFLPIIGFLLFLAFRADGYLDPFYIRFTTPKHKSMILGTSKAAQGLKPSVFEEILQEPIGNYAFTVAHSSYGKVYFESIKRKHSQETGGVFIVTVDPWSITNWETSPNDLSEFRENDLCVARTKVVDMNPNLLYLYNHYSKKVRELMYAKKGAMFLHRDGWLEISNIAMDSVNVARRIERKAEKYRSNRLAHAKTSSLRIEYLIKTINYLKIYGKVFIVRLPVHSQFLTIENEVIPNFDQRIGKAIELSDGYLDLTSEGELYKYLDGIHLHKGSAKEVSTKIANWIKETNQVN